MTMNFYRLKTHLCMEWTQTKKLNDLYICTFFVMYHFHQIYYKISNKINTCEHVKRKPILFVDFIVHCFPCMKQKSYNLYKWMGIIHKFKTIHTYKRKKKFQSLKSLKPNENMSFFQFISSLNLDEIIVK
jgi:hypothetical protein